MPKVSKEEALAQKLHAIYHDFSRTAPAVRADPNPDWGTLEKEHQDMWKSIAQTAMAECDKEEDEEHEVVVKDNTTTGTQGLHRGTLPQVHKK